MTPKPEARIAAQERYTLHLAGRIEELAQDTDESLRAIQQDHRALYDHVQKGFDQAHAFVQERFEEIGTRLDRIEQAQTEQSKRFDRIETSLDELKQLLLQIAKQRPGE